MSGAPDDLDMLAAEYALGLLAPAEEAAAEARLAREPAFAAAVERWRACLLPLDEAARRLAVPPDLWTRIEAATHRAPFRTEERRFARAGVWDSLVFWRRWGLGAAAACVLLLAGIGVQTYRAERTPLMVAVLLGGENRPVAVVNTFADGRVDLVPLSSVEVPAGRALEIWTLWDRAVGPRSVGVLERPRSARLRLESLPLGPDQLFEITLEPAGGSPTGRPTGPVLAVGRTSRAL